MPITVKNLTESVLLVPVVNFRLGPRAVRYFANQEFDEVYNNPTARKLIDQNVLAISTFDIYETGEDPEVQSDVANSIVFDVTGTIVYAVDGTIVMN